MKTFIVTKILEVLTILLQIYRKFCTTFNLKSLGDHHILLADVFEVFQRKFPKTYNFDSVCLYSTSGLAWIKASVMIDIELELLAVTNMLLMGKKRLELELSKKYLYVSKVTMNI